tara:strand:+ start:484 stop:678 length:195 start_codon:yes stop_codon:yes gene_type:complete
MDMVLVLVTGVITIVLLQGVLIILELSKLKVVARIRFVQVEFIGVVQESVTVAKGVHPMLMVIT